MITAAEHFVYKGLPILFNSDLRITTTLAALLPRYRNEAKDSKLTVWQPRPSYNITRASAYPEGLGVSASRRVPHRHLDRNHVYIPVKWWLSPTPDDTLVRLTFH